MNIKTATPAEIDDTIDNLGFERIKCLAAIDRAKVIIERAKGESGHWVTEAALAEAEATVVTATKGVHEIEAKIAPLDAEYEARGRWTRYFLVRNNNGHVHMDTSCETCFLTTSYGWMTTLSGATTEELVEKMGETACTVCFPAAPAMKGFGEYGKREKAARAAEKAEKKAVKEAKMVFGPTGKMLFKTERGASNEMMYDLESAADIAAHIAHSTDRAEYLTGLKAERIEKALVIGRALAAKRGVTLEEVIGEALSKLAKKLAK